MSISLTESALAKLAKRDGTFRPADNTTDGYCELTVNGEKSPFKWARMMLYKCATADGTAFDATLRILPYNTTGGVRELCAAIVPGVRLEGDPDQTRTFVLKVEEVPARGSIDGGELETYLEVRALQQGEPESSARVNCASTMAGIVDLAMHALLPLDMRRSFDPSALLESPARPASVGIRARLRPERERDASAPVSRYDFASMDRRFEANFTALAASPAAYHAMFAPYIDPSFGNTSSEALRTLRTLASWYCECAGRDASRLGALFSHAEAFLANPGLFASDVEGGGQAAARRTDASAVWWGERDGGRCPWGVMLPVGNDTAGHATAVLVLRTADGHLDVAVVNTGYNPRSKKYASARTLVVYRERDSTTIVRKRPSPSSSSSSSPPRVTGRDAVAAVAWSIAQTLNTMSMEKTFEALEEAIRGIGCEPLAEPPPEYPRVPNQEGGSCTWNSALWGLICLMCASNATPDADGSTLAPGDAGEVVEFCACACARLVVSTAAAATERLARRAPMDLRHALELCTRGAYPGGARPLRFAELRADGAWHACDRAETAAAFFARTTRPTTQTERCIEMLWPAMRATRGAVRSEVRVEEAVDPEARDAVATMFDRPRRVGPSDSVERMLLTSLETLVAVCKTERDAMSTSAWTYAVIASARAASSAAAKAMRLPTDHVYSDAGACADALFDAMEVMAHPAPNSGGESRLEVGAVPGVGELLISITYCVDRMYGRLVDARIFSESGARDVDVQNAGGWYGHMLHLMTPHYQCVHVADDLSPPDVFPLSAIVRAMRDRIAHVVPVWTEVLRSGRGSVECATHAGMYNLGRNEPTYDEDDDMSGEDEEMAEVEDETTAAYKCLWALSAMASLMIHGAEGKSVAMKPGQYISVLLRKSHFALMDLNIPRPADHTNHLDVLSALADPALSATDVGEACKPFVDEPGNVGRRVLDAETPCRPTAEPTGAYVQASARKTKDTRKSLGERPVRELRWQYAAAARMRSLSRLPCVPDSHMRATLLLAAYVGHPDALKCAEFAEEDLRDQQQHRSTGSTASDLDLERVTCDRAIMRHIKCVADELKTGVPSASLHETFRAAVEALTSSHQQSPVSLFTGYSSYSVSRLDDPSLIADEAAAARDWAAVCADPLTKNEGGSWQAVLRRARRMYGRDASVVDELVPGGPGDPWSPYTRVKVGEGDVRLFSHAHEARARTAQTVHRSLFFGGGDDDDDDERRDPARMLVERPAAGSGAKPRAFANGRVSFAAELIERDDMDESGPALALSLLPDTVSGAGDLSESMWMRPGDRVWLVQQPQRESARGGAGCVAAMMVAAKPAESYSLYRVTETDNPDESLCEHLRYVIVCDDRSDGAVVACSVRPADDDRDGDGVQVKICAVSGGVVVRGTVVTTRSKADDGAPLAMHSRWSTASAGCVAVLNEADDRVWIVSVDPAITPDDDDDVESSAWSPLCATRAAYEGGKGHVAGEDYEDDGPAGGRGGPDMARWLAAGSRVVLTRVSVSGLCLERTGGPEDQMRMRAALDVADYDTALSMGWRGFETGARVEWCTNWRDNAWEEGKDRAAYVPPEGVTDLARYSTASITQDGRPRRAAQDWPTLGEEMHAAVEIMRAVSAWVTGGCTGAKCSCGAACSDFAESFRGCGSVPTDGLTAARDKLRRALDLVVANARLEDAFAFAFDGDGSDCHGRENRRPLLPRCAAEALARNGAGVRRWIYAWVLRGALRETLRRLDALLARLRASNAETAYVLDVLHAIELVDTHVVDVESDRPAHVVLAEESSGFVMRRQQADMLGKLLADRGARQAVQMAMGGGKSSFVIPALLYEDLANREGFGARWAGECTVVDRIAVVVPEQLVAQTRRTVAAACSRLGGFAVSTFGGRAGVVEPAPLNGASWGDVTVFGDKTLQTTLASGLPSAAGAEPAREYDRFARWWKGMFVVADEVDRVTDAASCELNAPVRAAQADPQGVVASIEALAAYAAFGARVSALRPAVAAKVDACAATADGMRVGVAYGFGDERADGVVAMSPENYALAVPYYRARSPANRSQFNDFELRAVLTRRAYGRLVEEERAVRRCDVVAIAKAVTERVLPAAKGEEVPALVDAAAGACPESFRRMVAECVFRGRAAYAAAAPERADLGEAATAEQLRHLAGLLAFAAIVTHSGAPRDQHNVGMYEFFAPSACRRCAMFSGTVSKIYRADEDAGVALVAKALAGGPAGATEDNLPLTAVLPDGVTDAMVAAVVGDCACADGGPALAGEPARLVAAHSIDDRVSEDDVLGAFVGGSPRYDALIDACGALWRLPVRRYAEAIARATKRDVFFVAEDGERSVMDWDTGVVTKGASSMIGADRRSRPDPVAFYDHKSTVGVDFVQPARMRGLVVVDSRSTATDVAQSVFRLRRLTRGHAFDLMYVPRGHISADVPPGREAFSDQSDYDALVRLGDPRTRFAFFAGNEEAAVRRAAPLARAAALSALVRTRGGLLGGDGTSRVAVSLGFYRHTWCETGDLALVEPVGANEAVMRASVNDAVALCARAGLSPLRDSAVFSVLTRALYAARQSARSATAANSWQTETQAQAQTQTQTQTQAEQETEAQCASAMAAIPYVAASFADAVASPPRPREDGDEGPSGDFRAWMAEAAARAGGLEYAMDASSMLDHLFVGIDRRRAIGSKRDNDRTGYVDPIDERLFLVTFPSGIAGRPRSIVCTSVDASAIVHAVQMGVDAAPNSCAVTTANGVVIYGGDGAARAPLFPFDVGTMEHALAFHRYSKKNERDAPREKGVPLTHEAAVTYGRLLIGTEEERTVASMDLVRALTNGRVVIQK